MRSEAPHCLACRLGRALNERQIHQRISDPKHNKEYRQRLKFRLCELCDYMYRNFLNFRYETDLAATVRALEQGS